MRHGKIKKLPPILHSDLSVVFVGTAPGKLSLAVGHYYADPTNSFWRHLYETGWTDRLLDCREDHLLTRCGIGLDDVYADANGLRSRLEEHRPRAVCFNSKAGLEDCALPPRGREWRGDAAGQFVSFAGVETVWAIPDSSGQARKYHPERLELLRQLRARLRKA